MRPSVHPDDKRRAILPGADGVGNRRAVGHLRVAPDPEAERSLHEKVGQLEKVARMTRELASTPGVEELGEKILQICLDESGMKRGVIRLYDPDSR